MMQMLTNRQESPVNFKLNYGVLWVVGNGHKILILLEDFIIEYRILERQVRHLDMQAKCL